MKKGKRQVVDKNLFEPQDNENNSTNTTFQFLSATNEQLQQERNDAQLVENQSISKKGQFQAIGSSKTAKVQASQPSKIQSKLEVDNAAFSPISEQKYQNLKSEENDQSRFRSNNQKEDDRDDKKTRIELLKQKYLKTKPKAAQSEIKEPQPLQSQMTKVSTPEISTKFEIKQIAPPIETEKSNEEIVKQNKKEEEQTLPFKPPPKNQSKIQKIEQQEKIIVNEETDKQIKKEDEEAVEKKQIKKGNKVPPPPPPKKIGVKAPVTAKQLNLPPQNLQPQVVMSEKQVETANLKQKQEQIIQAVTIKKPASRPNSVQQILAKRMKKEQTVIPKKIQEDVQTFFEPQAQEQSQQYRKPIIASSMPLDQEYLDKKTEIIADSASINKSVEYSEDLYELSLIEATKAWYCDGDSFFYKILPKTSSLRVYLFDTQNQKQLKLSSKNPSFNPILSRMLIEFVFMSKCELTEGQKYLLGDLSLQFFYSDLNCLTTEFLLISTKVGPSCLSKYAQFFQKNPKSYCLTMLRYKEYFLPQQLANFVNFMIEAVDPAEELIHLLILLQPTEQLSVFLSNRSFSNQLSLILSLGACQFALKTNKHIFGMYFRLINKLLDNIAGDNELLEGVLKYINHLESHEKYYQLQKQLKLKLINMINNTAKKTQKPLPKEKKEEESGIMGIWNKAVDKLKTATQFNQKEKKKDEDVAVEKQEEQKQEITYDPVLKRYLINGKVPEDEDGSSRNTGAAAKPPPPPPKANRPVVPPPPVGKKGRTVTSSNRYA